MRPLSGPMSRPSGDLETRSKDTIVSPDDRLPRPQVLLRIPSKSLRMQADDFIMVAP